MCTVRNKCPNIDTDNGPDPGCSYDPYPDQDLDNNYKSFSDHKCDPDNNNKYDTDTLTQSLSILSLETDPNSDPDPQYDPDTDPDPDLNPDPDTHHDPDPDSDPDPDFDPDLDPDHDHYPDLDPDTYHDSDPDSESDHDPDPYPSLAPTLILTLTLTHTWLSVWCLWSSSLFLSAFFLRPISWLL